jgi:hypothetical protein
MEGAPSDRPRPPFFLPRASYLQANADLGRINVFYHEALGGKFVPCPILFNLEPGVVYPLFELFSPGKSNSNSN